ncbi:dolichyl-phosphate-mannose--protein mannosyltransferase [Ruania albidiflava]|uniref:dolichyl-phosphate-mannose--protein mannosyltransferase n=1 Tax=Ruania albidiflava TaxID=366586 RepID=UPI0023F07BCD|nr:phospholipid carrier-dependent glycosyltransferase [Ruania albidiflava]
MRAEGAQEGAREGDPTASAPTLAGSITRTTAEVPGSSGTATARHAAPVPNRWHQLQALVRRPPLPGTHTAAEIRTSLEDRLLPPVPGSRLWGWIGALLVTAVAGVLRLVHLERPDRLVFDETYYVKQAYSLLTLGYEGTWNEEPDERFAAGDFSDLNTDADYVVHPSVGKWMIAIGMRLLGPENPWGWRISAAVVGTLSVLLLARIARRLFSSSLLGCAAALLLAVDGEHIVLSRISILDIFLQFWVLAAFGALLLDRQWHRRHLAARAATELAARGSYGDPWGPKAGLRPWLLVAGVCLGLASGVKWSGIYALAVFGIVAVVWSVTARRELSVRLWSGAGLVRDGVRSFLVLVPTAAAVYVLTWLPWWLNPGSYYRHWASDVNAVAEHPQRPWLPDWLNSWWEYHLKMWHFHNNLTSEHTYMSHPAGWLIQWRPTSFAWRDVEDGTSMDLCGASRCVGAITSLGNPVLWWGGALALLLVVWLAVRHRDWRAWAILGGYAATYLPWFAYAERTIFTFYTVALAPFVALALTVALATLVGSPSWPLRERRPGIWTAAGIVVLAVLVGAFYWPIWSNQWVPYWFWRLHMLLPSWI